MIDFPRNNKIKLFSSLINCQMFLKSKFYNIDLFFLNLIIKLFFKYIKLIEV